MMLPGEECFRGNSWSQGPGVGAWRCVCGRGAGNSPEVNIQSEKGSIRTGS